LIGFETQPLSHRGRLKFVGAARWRDDETRGMWHKLPYTFRRDN